MQNQAYIFAIFILNGFLIGLLFDIFRIIRKSFKTPDFFTYIHDITFWIISGIIIMYSIFKFNNGELRLFIFLGIGLGLALYLLVFSKIFIKISVKLIFIFKKIFNIVFIIPIKFIIKVFIKIIIHPIRWLYLKIIGLNKKIIRKIKK